jgi:hypothetical protein
MRTSNPTSHKYFKDGVQWQVFTTTVNNLWVQQQQETADLLKENHGLLTLSISFKETLFCG